jgi:c-di-GMP-binding flagellar brake protein YcgR
MDKEIFSLISQKELIQIMQDLAYLKIDIICKGESEHLATVKASECELKKSQLECIEKSTHPLKNGENYLGYFLLHNEKYYFKSTAISKSDTFIIPFPDNLYKLQRRQSYRVKIPDNQKLFLDISTLDGLEFSSHCRLIDLSSKGCRITVDDYDEIFMKDCLISGTLLVKENLKINIQGQIKHSTKSLSSSDSKICGIEFTPISPATENQLFSLTMELYKSFFRREL